MELLLLLLGMLLAGFAGYTAQSVSICSVRAVAETIDGGDCRVLLSFGKAAIWAAAVAAPLGWAVFGAIDTEMPRLTLLVVCGACLFGSGASVSGGCAVWTVNGLASGEALMLITLAGLAPGWLFGLQVNGWVGLGAIPFLPAPGTLEGA